jgi:cysteine desulfurase / selenocysteine lyase
MQISQKPNLRSQFPIFSQPINSKNYTYLDSAATCQKPQQVIDSITNFYSHQYSSNHSVHYLANQLSFEVENTRKQVANFVGAKANEIIFTNNATDSINLVANGFFIHSLSDFEHKKTSVELGINLGTEGAVGLYEKMLDSIKDNKRKIPFKLIPSDKILVGIDQHHSNLIPWQRLAQRIGCQIDYFGLTNSGEVDTNDLKSKLVGTRLVCVSQVSNVLGVVNNIKQICSLAHQYEALVMVDGTQAVAHLDIDVKDLDCDFYCFSGHKIYGPTGIGVLYGKANLLVDMPNYKLGGEMVQEVSVISGNTWKDSPYRFEAGTLDFAGIIGLQSAISWFIKNKSQIFEIEKNLNNHLFQNLEKIKNLEIFGNLDLSNTSNRIPILTANIKNQNALDIATILDTKGIAIRSGQHCTGLLHEYYDTYSSWRVSLSCYNTTEEIDFFIEQINLLTR